MPAEESLQLIAVCSHGLGHTVVLLGHKNLSERVETEKRRLEALHAKRHLRTHLGLLTLILEHFPLTHPSQRFYITSRPGQTEIVDQIGSVGSDSQETSC